VLRSRLEAAQLLLERLAGAPWAPVSQAGGPAGAHVYTRDAHTSPGEAARLLSRQFWSLALQARRRDTRPIAEEPSDVGFFEAENEFFERAARFEQRHARP
jgi:hypothetical protein